MKLYLKIRRRFRQRLLLSSQPCRQIVPLMSESLERRLSIVERVRLRIHMIVCDWCRRYLEQVGLLQQVAQTDSSTQIVEATTVRLSDEARRRLLASLKRESD
ncbi:MAG TPA: zf-HC2 domain-containing protein [Pyrinomonadaceae bacterium]|nr:zf-HC2 domain-containing protein [Pyrinomonadaceae bacterium]